MTLEVKIIVFVVCFMLLICSAFFSASEYVFANINKFKVKKDIENKKPKAKLVYKLADNYSYTISIILIGNNLVNILITSLTTIYALSNNLNETLIVLILTVIILIFGEMLPKTLGHRFCYQLAYLFSKPLTFFSYIVYPIVKFVNFMIAKMSPLWTKHEDDDVEATVELSIITDQLEEDGVIDENDAELIHNAIELTDSTVLEIMVPRVDVFAIDINDSNDEILNDPELFRYSRVPVYDESKDDIIGIINTATLMKKSILNQEINIRELMTPPLFVPKHIDAVSMLTEFREKNEEIAVILDEFGGVKGIVTSEDILEELVGEIFDEVDVIKYECVENPDGTFQIDGDMNIYDFFEMIEYEEEFDAEYTTVGGWCTHMLEDFPDVGEEFDFENAHIVIAKMDNIRVEEITLTINKKEESED